MSPPTYKYRPLSTGGCIRLVHLTKEDKALHGFSIRLSETSLGGSLRTPFNALSYTWGLPFHTDILDLEKLNLDGGEIFTISVDGDGDHQVTITENLFYAMKQLVGNAELENEPVPPLWIDALSINQQDEAEKSSQVNMMSDIYSTASRVIVWLGKEDPAPRFVSLHSNMELEKYLTDVALGIRDGIPTATVLEKLGLVSLQEWQDMWWEYVSFYRRQRYFRRVWIIQETALARDITVLCGSHTLDWTRMVVIGNLLHISNVGAQWTLLGPRMALLAQTGGWTPGNEIRQLHMFRTDHRINGGLPMHLHQTKANFMRGRQDLTSVDLATEALLRGLGALGDKHHKEYAYFSLILRQFADYQTTDKRDHVFAALAFCRPFFTKAGMEPPITPSYKMTVQEVFTQVTLKLLTSLPVLSLLSFVTDEKRRIPSLPSWVPDFTAPFASRPLILRGFVPSPNFPASDIMEPIYNASLLPSPHAKFPLATTIPSPDSPDSPSASQLLLSATQIGTISQICPATFPTVAEFTYTPYLSFISSHLPTIYPPTAQPREEALWRTLFGNYCDSHTLEYPASYMVGMTFFRQHVLENVAVNVISKIGEDGNLVGFFAEQMRVSLLLGGLAAESDKGEAFLPGPIDLAAQIGVYFGKAFGVMEGMGIVGGPQVGDGVREEVGTAMAASLGTSEAEVACMTMLGQGMTVPHKRVYVTREGYMGVGPPGMREGDGVWVVRGARVPFVLREESGGYKLLGETYLHGAMNGEMLSGGKGAGEKEIVLC